MIEPIDDETMLTLPSFILSCIGDKVVIIRTAGPAEGEGGLFDLKEFDAAVNKFFTDRF